MEGIDLNSYKIEEFYDDSDIDEYLSFLFKRCHKQYKQYKNFKTRFDNLTELDKNSIIQTFNYAYPNAKFIADDGFKGRTVKIKNTVFPIIFLYIMPLSSLKNLYRICDLKYDLITYQNRNLSDKILIDRIRDTSEFKI